MDFRTFTAKFGEKYPISVSQIRLQDNNFFLQQLNTREKKGRMQNIIRGWRISNKAVNERGIGAIVANSIYEPSYLGLEWALRYYNLIPEGVYTYISCTTKKTIRYKTILGNFVYRKIHPRYYRGYDLIQIGSYKNIRISSPEKTICDYIYLHPEIINKDDFQEQRINTIVWQDIASDKTLLNYSKKYPIRVQNIVKIFLNYIHNHD